MSLIPEGKLLCHKVKHIHITVHTIHTAVSTCLNTSDMIYDCTQKSETAAEELIKQKLINR